MKGMGVTALVALTVGFAAMRSSLKAGESMPAKEVETASPPPTTEPDFSDAVTPLNSITARQSPNRYVGKTVYVERMQCLTYSGNYICHWGNQPVVLIAPEVMGTAAKDRIDRLCHNVAEGTRCVMRVALKVAEYDTDPSGTIRRLYGPKLVLEDNRVNR